MATLIVAFPDFSDKSTNPEKLFPEPSRLSRKSL